MIHVNPQYLQRLQQAAHALLEYPEIPVGITLNRLGGPETLDSPETLGGPETTGQTLWRLGLRNRKLLEGSGPEDAARMILDQDLRVMGRQHITQATSLWALYNFNSSYTTDLMQDLDVQAGSRTIYMGSPHIPAVLWRFQDGSRIVMYSSQVSTAVHRDRVPAIQEDYIQEARKSLRRVERRARSGSSRPLIPIVPMPEFAQANDGILSHQAALPLDADDCWCHQDHSLGEGINEVRG